MKKLTKIFSHTFDHRLWQILPAGSQPELLLEVRDEESAKITIYRYVSGEALHAITPEDMPWWSTLVSARDKLFICRSYGSGGNAGEQQIIAFDGETGRRKWEREGVLLSDEGQDWVAVSQHGEDRILDVQTGEPYPAHDLTNTIENKWSSFPFRYSEGSAYFETVGSFLEKKGLPKPSGAIDYLETGNRIIISVFYRSAENLENSLYVFNMKGEIYFKEKIGSNLKGLTDNTFFIFSGNLIFVTSRNDFFEYSLA